MTNRLESVQLVGPFGRAIALGGAIAIVVVGLGVSGCGEEPPPPPPPPPPAPTGPDWTLDDIEMDERVQFPDKYTPSDESLAQAVATLASAIVDGDEREFQRLLSPSDARVLQLLTSSDAWDEATGDLRAIRVVRLDERPDGAAVGLAYENRDGATLMGWVAAETGEGQWRFSSFAVTPRRADSVAALDDTELLPPEFDLSMRIEELIELVEEQARTGGGDRNQGGFGVR